MTIHIFGHYSPDTDSTGSPILWAWYLNQIKGQAAAPTLLGTPNTEAAFVLKYWNIETPVINDSFEDSASVIIVDTNNPSELPANVNALDIRAIIDHHKLVGGLETKGPIDITVRPLACTATIMLDLMGPEARDLMPEAIKGVALSCILSDTLEFRSPTTTDHDRATAIALAHDLDIDLSSYAAEMFAAKSDVSAFSDADLIRMDSKKYSVNGINFRVSVLETTAPAIPLDRKKSLMASYADVCAEDGVDQVLLFVVDIIREEATLLVPNAVVKSLAENSFGIVVTDDTVVLPGVMSRKKQIIPNLTI